MTDNKQRFHEERSLLEIKLSEKQLELENAKLELECKRGKLMISEAERDERNALSKAGEARVYNFVDSVGASSVKSCVTIIDEWARRSNDPITIIFNSPGGEVFAGLALYDAIEALKKKKIHVTTICRGTAASMGGILFQAGDDRVIGANAYVLIHEVSSVEIGKTAELEDELELTKRLQKRLLQILTRRSKLTPKQVAQKWKKTDWWLDAKECVDFGFADRVG